MPFKIIGLCDELVQGILATGYTCPTEIQSAAIPAVLSGRDLVACAQTGTGKTAAFVLPILNRIQTVEAKAKKKLPRALIITPTRELAMQVDESVRGYGRFMKLFSMSIYGGMPMDKQIKKIRRGVDVIVATPGRLIDHVNRGTINLSAIEMLVLDEADRMLDMGFVNDIRKIIQKVPSERQTLLFSATISKQISLLTKDILNNPETIQIGKQHDPIQTITQYIYPVIQEQKMDMLLHLIKSKQMFSVLIFSRTKHGADKICRNLVKNDIKAEAIHSNRTQKQRQRAMDGFRSGKFQVMVATDIAARGIDVEGISHVFNYDVPAYAEDYVHRIGRTGRAAATGDAITFVSYDEIFYLKKIEKFIDRRFTAEYLDDFEYIRRLDLNDGPKKEKSGGRKKVGSSQRRRMKSKESAQGGKKRSADQESSGKKYFGKKSSDKKLSGKNKSAKKEKIESVNSSDKTKSSKPNKKRTVAKGAASSPKKAGWKSKPKSENQNKPKNKSKASDGSFRNKKKKVRR